MEYVYGVLAIGDKKVHWMWLRGRRVMLKSVGIVSGHLPLLPEALPEGLCSDFEGDLFLC
jgi:hypothetical protein